LKKEVHWVLIGISSKPKRDFHGEDMNRCILKRLPVIMSMNYYHHTSVSYERISNIEIIADLLNILAVIKTELLDPYWGMHRSDVINPGENESPRIVAGKIARSLQSTVSSNPAVLQNLLASRG
jgi:hypothetical protein